jgi:HEAT repeat protein
VLNDVALVRLEEEQSPTGGDERSQERLTRLEPRLVSYRMQPGQYRLSLRGLASMVNLLPPESISLEAAAAALHSTEFFVRYCAAELLSRRGDRDARMILEDALLHGPGTVRASAAHHLHRLSWFVAEPLLRQALQDPDPRVHVSAMYALCEVRSADGYQLMLEALPHESDQVRLAAVWGLWYNLDRKALPVIELVMLGAIGVPLAIPIVRQALDDRDLDVKYAAALSLVELAREDCFDELASLIAGTAGAVRRCFLRGLFHAANYLQIDLAKSAAAEHVVDALEAAMHDESSEVRMAAALPLAWLRHERAAAALLEGYRRESDGETKAQLLHIGVSLASPAGAAMLAEALDSDETPVREAADYLVHHCPPPAVA